MGNLFSDVSFILNKGTAKQQIKDISMRIVEEIEELKTQIENINIE